MSTRFLKKIVASRLPGKVFLTGVLTGLIVISAAWGQTTPANPSGQVRPGTTASIGPKQGVGDAAHQALLDNALTPQTRQTLQDAMNSYDGGAAGNSAVAGEIILGPGEAAQLEKGTVGRIAFNTLPNRVKGALGAPVHATLNSSQGR